MSETTGAVSAAQRVAVEIFRDISARRGLRQALEQIDPETVESMVLAWAEIIRREFGSAALAAKDAEIARLREALIVARGAIDYDISPKAFDIVDRALTPPGTEP